MTEPEPPTVFKAGTPFQLSTLTQGDRADIVALTTSGAAPDLLEVAALELGALGATVDLTGNWAPRKGFDFAGWSEQGHGGRTVRSTVLRRGYLFPLGHRADIVEVFHRLVAVDPHNAPSDPANYPVAYLQKRTFITVTEPVKSYPAIGQPFGPPIAAPRAGTTDWPFTSVRMVTLTSPPLAQPDTFVGTQSIWPMVAGASGGATADLVWNFIATDADGHDVAFAMPLAFVYGEDDAAGYVQSEFDAPWPAELIHYYQVQAGRHATSTPTNAAPLTFAPVPAQAPPGSTTHPTVLITLGAASTQLDPNLVNVPNGSDRAAPGSPAHPDILQAAGQPNFYPTISSARVRLRAADALVALDGDHNGLSDSDTDPVGGVAFQYYPRYVRYGVSGYGRQSAPADPPATNIGSLYMQALTPPRLTLPSASVGAVATPDIGVVALSAESGIVGGSLGALDAFATTARADLEDYFSALTAQLFGCLPLDGILDSAAFAMPTIVAKIDPATQLPIVSYSLVTALGSFTNTHLAPNPIFVPDPGGRLQLSATFTDDPQADATYSVEGMVDPFWLYLLGDPSNNNAASFLSLHVNSLRFASATGNSPNIDIGIDQVVFTGPLSFVNSLEQFFHNLGGAGLSVAVQGSTIVASSSITLPNVSVGIFQLSGLNFASQLLLPLIDGQATASFAFASQDNPFTLAVAMFGGGGFLDLTVNFGGVQAVHGALEFSGQLGFDIGVASGALSLTAGIYFSYTGPDATPAGNGLALAGFVRVTGQLSVLGVLTISASLDLSLEYVPATNSVWGSAGLTVGVSVCGFSKSVTVTISKTFSGPPPATNEITPALHADFAIVSGASATADPSPAAGPWNRVVSSTGVWDRYCAAFGAGTMQAP